MDKLFLNGWENSQREQKEEFPTPSIRLEFFRHSEQEPRTEEIQEYKRRLTSKGRGMATEAGKDRKPNPKMSVVSGSPRDRARETAFRQIFTNEEGVTPESSLEDIEEMIKGQLPVGKKHIIDERLNFNWDGSKKFKESQEKHYLQIKDSLEFLVQESDQLVLEEHDATSTSYTRSAANTAELIQKYLKILPNWKKTAMMDAERKPDEQKGYIENNNELQRFFGSHAGTVENFLLKLIDKTEGREAVLDFIKNLPDLNGFQFNDGYSVCLIDKNGRTNIEVKYHDKVWNIEPSLLEEMVTERNQLNAKIEQSK